MLSMATNHTALVLPGCGTLVPEHLEQRATHSRHPQVAYPAHKTVCKLMSGMRKFDIQWLDKLRQSHKSHMRSDSHIPDTIILLRH